MFDSVQDAIWSLAENTVEDLEPDNNGDVKA